MFRRLRLLIFRFPGQNGPSSTEYAARNAKSQRSRKGTLARFLIRQAGPLRFPQAGRTGSGSAEAGRRTRHSSSDCGDRRGRRPVFPAPHLPRSGIPDLRFLPLEKSSGSLLSVSEGL